MTRRVLGTSAISSDWRAIRNASECVVHGGGKQAIFGDEAVSFRQGQSAVIGIDLATYSSVIEASDASPYITLAMRLDLSLLRDLATEVGIKEETDDAPGIISSETDEALLSAIGRLFDLVDQPRSIPVLAPSWFGRSTTGCFRRESAFSCARYL